VYEQSDKVIESARESAVAGSFYSADKKQLTLDVKTALANAKSFKEEEVRAIIVPHAGYVFSANVAATSYKTLNQKYKNVFLIGSSHHVNFNGVSIYNQGNYKTPLGEVKVNKEIVDALMQNSSLITYRQEAHAREHTLEVQLPFLQTIYGEELQIIPIIIASSDIETIKALSTLLKPYFTADNLFVISTDLSHYPSYEDAYRVDKNILDALVKNEPNKLINAILENENTHTKNLQTSACGWASLLTLELLTQEPIYKYELLEYKNSGDTLYGEKDRVVGYGALRVYKSNKEFTLNEEEKNELKEIARMALYEAVTNQKRIQLDPQKLSAKLSQHLGAFVTLSRKSKLRGCIGRFEPNQPLYEVVIEMAISASRYDTRFTPVTQDELEDIDIEISVLTPRRQVSSLDEVIIGKHGIYVEYGSLNGTYLPQVATDMGWNKEQFIQSCCAEKARINPSNCKDAKLYIYEAIVF
jgi:AmmeMemoRadiSam system protein B/AmmeMemoRadiSam system protein A